MSGVQPLPDPGDGAAAAGAAPLAGIVVADFTRVLAGPYCAQLLGDMGALVIKVESPEGDENRRWPPFWDGGMSSNYGSVNRGKLGLALDLKAPAAGEVVERLVARADVVLHNFLPATAARLGLSAERVRALNPRAVVGVLSGYGAHGPLADKPGYDLMMQAFSGATSLTGYEGGPPVRVGVSFIDMAAGISMYAAVLTALFARQRTGEGGVVRTSLMETAVSILGYHGVAWLQKGVVPRKEGCHAGNLSPYQPFLCADGHLVVGATNDRVFALLCDVIGRPELLADPRFASNALRIEHRAALNEVLEPAFLARTRADWAGRLDARGVPNSPVHTVDEVMTHPQVLANAMVIDAATADGASVKVLGTPFKVEGMAPGVPRAAPALGGDSERVLAWLGCSGDTIAALREAGARGAASPA